jgi:hypothetical protein
MKFKGLIAINIGIMSLLLFTCQHNMDNSKVHEKIVQITQQMESGVEALEKKIKDVSDLIDTKNAQINSLENPDSSMIAEVKNHATVLATHIGLLEKNRVLIAQHKSYINDHENSALSLNEIKVQHRQMKKNYEDFQRDSIGIIAELETLKLN